MMHFVLPIPSLHHLAAVKIVSHVASQPNIITRIAQSLKDRCAYILDVVEEVLTEAMEFQVKIQLLTPTLPLPCVKLLLKLIEPMRKEIFTWCHYNIIEYDRVQFLDMLLYNQLRWTMHGTIDYARTAELMVKDGRLHPESRYEIACVNCLEDEARQLFQSMGEELRREYVNEVRNIRRSEHHKLLTFFTLTLSGDADGLNRHFQCFPTDSINQRLFVDTLRWGTRATCEYFYKKLNQEEKERVLGQCERRAYVKEEIPTCNFFYYLSLMNAEQQESMFDRCAVEVLLFLLRWPMQALFLTAVGKCGWSSMDSRECSVVFCAIADNMHGDEDYDYSQLFWECWRQRPLGARRFHLTDYPFLIKLMDTDRREEFVRLINNEAPRETILELNRYYRELEEESSDESACFDVEMWDSSSYEEDESEEMSEEEAKSSD